MTETLSKQKTTKTAAIKSALGANYVYQFDIFVPVIALAPVNSDLFGVGNLAQTAGLIFVATLIGRPLGSLIFGPLADQIGRTKTSIITLGGISITTYAIAITADHTQWGIWSLYWVIAMRFIGGIFLGGQYSAAIPLAMEWTKPHLRGLLSGGIMAMSPLANVSIAALTMVLLNQLGPDTYAQWGWRIPFLISATMAAALMVQYWKRVHDQEAPQTAPQTTNVRQFGHSIHAVVWGKHKLVFIKVLCIMTGLWTLTNMAIPVVTEHLTAHGNWLPGQVPLIMMWGTGASIFSMLACGHLSTLIGRQRFFAYAGPIVLVAAPISYIAMVNAHTLAGVISAVVLLQIFTVSLYGPIGAYLSEEFPPHLRSTGYGLGYSLAIVVPAFYPSYLPLMQESLGYTQAVVLLLIIAGLLVAIGAQIKTPSQQVEQQQEASQL